MREEVLQMREEALQRLEELLFVVAHS